MRGIETRFTFIHRKILDCIRTLKRTLPRNGEQLIFHCRWIDENKNKPEKLNYERAAKKFALNLQDIVGGSTNADLVKKAMGLLKNAKASIDIFLLRCVIAR